MLRLRAPKAGMLKEVHQLRKILYTARKARFAGLLLDCDEPGGRHGECTTDARAEAGVGARDGGGGQRRRLRPAGRRGSQLPLPAAQGSRGGNAGVVAGTKAGSALRERRARSPSPGPVPYQAARAGGPALADPRAGHGLDAERADGSWHCKKKTASPHSCLPFRDSAGSSPSCSNLPKWPPVGCESDSMVPLEGFWPGSRPATPAPAAPS